jgi:hypothetical protein
VKLWVPALENVEVRTATLELSRARVPSKVVPSKNETWPKGLPEGELTAAVRAKVDPTCGAAGRVARLVVVVIPFTTIESGAEAPGAELASP